MVSVLRPGQRILSIPGFGVTTSRRAVQSAAADWWAVAGKTCVAAYQPKGAASYAASKVNLANPGTDITDGTAYPTWNATDGWIIDASLSQYLDTNIVPELDGTCSILIRQIYSGYNLGTGYPSVIGVRENNTDYPDVLICIDNAGNAASNTTKFRNGNVAGGDYSPRLSSGVTAMAGNKAYSNGSEVATLTAGSAVTGTRPLYIGAQNDRGTAWYFFGGTVQAVAIYSDTLTAGEVATVSAAMAAL